MAIRPRSLMLVFLLGFEGVLPLGCHFDSMIAVHYYAAEKRSELRVLDASRWPASAPSDGSAGGSKGGTPPSPGELFLESLGR